MNDWFAILALWSLPLIGALNGWFTTWLAIRMLFRPRKPLRILGYLYQAPLPRRQAEIAERVGAIVEEELLSYADIRTQVVTPAFLRQVNSAIEAKIGQMLAERRATLPSLVQKLLVDELLVRMQHVLAREVSRHLPQLIDQMFVLLSTNVSMQRLIAQKVAAFELERLEEVVFSLAAKELRLIELLCGALGLLIGLCQLVFALVTR
jgi:uncharacterized membrane protein YheB (UPF0754 family)